MTYNSKEVNINNDNLERIFSTLDGELKELWSKEIKWR